MKKRIFNIVINEDDATGMDAISLVDMPAVEHNYLKFNEDKPIVRYNFNEDERIITGVVALADTPIYRYSQEIGEYYVNFTADTIKKMIVKYSKNGLFNSVNLQHDDNTFQDGIYMFESYIKNSERGIVPTEFDDIPDGSWIASFKVENEELWDEIKNSGELNGFSLQGMFLLEEVFSKIEKPKAVENPIDELIDEVLK